MLRLAFTLAFALVWTALPALAHADEWSNTAELQRSNATTIRVTEPEGYQVTVNGRADTVPAVFAFDDADAYVMLKVSAPSGATWERKIEVKAYYETVVRVRHVAAAAAPKPARATASYVGVIANTSHACKDASDRRDIRVEFVLGAQVVKAVDVATRARADAELPGGEYRVRRFVRGANGWEFAATDALTIDKDGWVYHWGCQ